MESYSQPYQGSGGAIEKSIEDGNDDTNSNEKSGEGNGNGEGEDEEEEEEEEDEEEEMPGGYTLQQMQLHAAMVTEDNTGEEGSVDNSCQLLWQGIQAKRTFMGFKFQVNLIIHCVVCVIRLD